MMGAPSSMMITNIGCPVLYAKRYVLLIKKGAGNKPARMFLGAMIIKHKLNLSDAETIEIIRERVPTCSTFVNRMIETSL